MTTNNQNQQTVWEQVYRAGYDTSDPTRLLGDINTKLTQVQSGLNLKANNDSPVLTGTPQAPTPPVSGAPGTQVLTVGYHQNAHTFARWTNTSGALGLPGSTWAVITSTGSLTNQLGSTTIGAGNQGIQLNQTGVWLVSWDGYFTVPAAGTGRRVLAALTLGASFGVNPMTVANEAAGTGYTADVHIQYCTTLTTAPTHLRPSLYCDATAGPIAVTLGALTAILVAPI